MNGARNKNILDYIVFNLTIDNSRALTNDLNRKFKIFLLLSTFSTILKTVIYFLIIAIAMI